MTEMEVPKFEEGEDDDWDTEDDEDTGDEEGDVEEEEE